jgi:hypothetical protein
MPALRTIGVPLDHLVAELVAFPLSSEWSFLHPSTTIDPSMEGHAGRLWRAAERQLLTSIPGFSVDELSALRDALWFRDANAEISLHEYLRGLSHDFLRIEGSFARPSLPEFRSTLESPLTNPEIVARQMLRWLTFALPPDLLLAGLDERPKRIEIVSPTLADTLRDRRYVETHLHLGAGVDFSTIWPGTLFLLASRTVTENFFESPGADFDGGRTLAPWLVRVALARYLLGLFVADRDGRSFPAYLDAVRPIVSRVAGAASFALMR